MGVHRIMLIDFLVNHIDGGWSPRDKRLGGTEESVVKWAEELYRRGHFVTVYMNGTGGYKDGVTYIGRNVYNKYAKQADVCINIKSSEVPPKVPTLYLTNEVDADQLDLSAYDGVIWPSQWAVDNIPVNNDNVFIVPHGYDETKIYPQRKHKNLCIYTSSPDRGLDTLAIIWPSIVDKHPDAQLIVTYGGPDLDLPNCVASEFTEEEMNELYRKADIWIHPANGGELFGISAIKAQAAACVPVYFPTMALSETVKEGIKCSYGGDMYFRLVEILGDEEKKLEIRNKLAKHTFPTWVTSTDALEKCILEICKSK